LEERKASSIAHKYVREEDDRENTPIREERPKLTVEMTMARRTLHGMGAIVRTQGDEAKRTILVVLLILLLPHAGADDVAVVGFGHVFLCIRGGSLVRSPRPAVGIRHRLGEIRR
jgi:hypothetical protein